MSGRMTMSIEQRRSGTSRQFRRTLRVLWAGWKSEFAATAEYRFDLVVGTVISAIWLGIAVAPVLVVAAHTDSSSGWTLPRLLFLQAVWYLTDAVIWIVLVPNVGRLQDQVRLGTLDGLLLRPVNSLVMCTLGRIRVVDIPKAVLAVGLGAWAVVLGGGPVGWLPSLAAFVAVVSSMVLTWAAGVLANYKSLTHVQFDGWAALDAAQTLARVPIPLYGPVLRVVLTAVVPIAFLATVPAQLFFGDAYVWLGLVAAVLAVGAVLLTSRLWRRELAHYAGAMG